MSAAAELAVRVRALEAPDDGAVVVAVEGRPGAGKTTFGDALAAEIGAVHVDLENLYPGWDGLEEGARLAAEELVVPAAAGEVAVVPQWDWVAMRPAEPLVVEPPEFLVISGTGSGSLAAAPHLALVAWMELGDSERRRRALERDGEIFAGVIYNPISDELFWAEKGNGAFVDTPNARSRRLRVSGRKDLGTALVGTGIPMMGRGDHPDYVAKLEAVMGKTAGVRRWGAASLDLAFVAAGRYDAFFEYDLAPWDVAAGLLMVREAGGRITDISGSPYQLGGASILTSNTGLHDAMVSALG